MELHDFIKATLTSISNGIIEAQKELNGKDVFINPETSMVGNSGQKILQKAGHRYIQELEFEILISVDEKSKDSGGGKIQVFNVASLGAGTTAENNTTNSNKIKFKIPVALPTCKTPTQYD
jgi:TRAP-type uncharacterized transport system substrate-binding protein